MGDDRSIPATFATPRRSYSLLDEEATEVAIDQSILDFGSCCAKTGIRQTFVICPAGELWILKHSDCHFVPLSDIENNNKNASAR